MKYFKINKLTSITENFNLKRVIEEIGIYSSNSKPKERPIKRGIERIRDHLKIKYNINNISKREIKSTYKIYHKLFKGKQLKVSINIMSILNSIFDIVHKEKALLHYCKNNAEYNKVEKLKSAKTIKCRDILYKDFFWSIDTHQGVILDNLLREKTKKQFLHLLNELNLFSKVCIKEE